MNVEFSSKRPLTPEQETLIKNMTEEVSGSKYKTISFKLTDTLVMTPFSEFCDMFMIMEDDFRMYYAGKTTFAEFRLESQEEAEKKCSSSGCVTIELIYDILMKKSKISPSAKDELLKRECELATYFCFPRDLGKTLFNAAKSNKKNIIVVADTIYPENTVKKILENCGYTSSHKLIIPQRLDISDSNKKAVFEKVLEISKTSSEKLLHIGGNVEHDVEVPIVMGIKALLITPSNPIMVRSGRLRGAIQARCVYNYDSADFLALHCVFGLYAAYGFDVPQNKTPLSDFCADRYLLGFIVLGSLSLLKGFSPMTEMQKTIISALESMPEARAGRDDFTELFRLNFNGFLDKFGYKGCEFPLLFLEKYASTGDKALFQKYISADELQQWANATKDPEIVPVYRRQVKKSAVSKLADKMFPPGTKVRNIADGMLVRMKSKGGDKGRK